MTAMGTTLPDSAAARRIFARRPPMTYADAPDSWPLGPSVPEPSGAWLLGAGVAGTTAMKFRSGLRVLNSWSGDRI